MGHVLSMDLRVRLLAAIDGGMSCRGAAARFGVAPSTAIRWRAQRREEPEDGCLSIIDSLDEAADGTVRNSVCGRA